MRDETIKTIRRIARELHAGMKRGGRQGTKKGKAGYVRRPKHPKGEKEQR